MKNGYFISEPDPVLYAKPPGHPVIIFTRKILLPMPYKFISQGAFIKRLYLFNGTFFRVIGERRIIMRFTASEVSNKIVFHLAGYFINYFRPGICWVVVLNTPYGGITKL